MADKQFYSLAGPFSLKDIATRIGAVSVEKSDENIIIYDVAPLDTAGQKDLSFLDNLKYKNEFIKTEAAACIVHPSQSKYAPQKTSLLISDNPYKAYALAAQEFYPNKPVEPHISTNAYIDHDVQIGEGCRIEPGVVIYKDVEIGSNCHIEANTVINYSVKIGNNCIIGPSVSLTHCSIGNRVKIYPGVRIGQDGFGFSPGLGGHIKVPQLGRAIIGDDCEIGANSTIDRGSGPDTIIGQGTWLDNLVQIGHNAKLGRGCVMASQSGLAGSAKVGDFVFIGGQVGISGHIKVGDGVKIAGQSGVIRDIPPGTTFGGTPAVPIKEWHRQTSALTNLIRAKGGKYIR